MALFDLSVFLCCVLLFLGRGLEATSGDADPIYKACVGQCKKTGCVQDECFNNSNFASDKKLAEGPWYLRWKEWDCLSDCRYHCMLSREAERLKLGEKPIKYHGKWSFQRSFVIQEPVSVALSTFNLALVFHGWLSFFILEYYKLPLRPTGKAYYEYTRFWLIYGILSMNSWFWSAIFHGRYVDLTEKLYYSSSLAFLGFALIIFIIRTLDVRAEAARVMVAAPILAFVTTHILYLNLVQLDYGVNTVVFVVISATKLVLLAIWGSRSRHPSRWKLWVVVVGGAVAMLVEIIDFPPYKDFMDAHALCQAITAPLNYIFWSFIRDDARFSTSYLINKAN